MEWTTAFDRDAKPQPCVFDAPIPIHVSISPCLPCHGVVIEYRVNDGPIHSVPALPFPADPSSTTRRFQAVLPANQFGRVEYIPTLLLNGVAISPRLRQNPPEISQLQLLPHTHLPERHPKANEIAAYQSKANPLWGWNSNFLGSLTARLRQEYVGPTPDGLRINWHVVEGIFYGPGFEASVCAGATDWMRIRPNGIGVIDVKATFKTMDGFLILVSYGGIVDLGPDGYQEILEGRANSFPPVVVTPTYVTAAEELA